MQSRNAEISIGNPQVGIYGKSTIRMVDLETGVVLNKLDMRSKYFGEGLAKKGNSLFQLNWQTHYGFVYNEELQTVIPTPLFINPPLALWLLEVLQFETDLTDGWGLTTDTVNLIATDGGDELIYLHPYNFRTKMKIKVTDGSHPIIRLNELEYIEGEVWANVWMKDCIARIDPNSGTVNSWLLLQDLKKDMLLRRIPQSVAPEVLNGIAYDKEKKRVFVTGKLWPLLYEIKLELVPENAVDINEIRKMCIPNFKT